MGGGGKENAGRAPAAGRRDVKLVVVSITGGSGGSNARAECGRIGSAMVQVFLTWCGRLYYCQTRAGMVISCLAPVVARILQRDSALYSIDCVGNATGL